MLRLKNDKPLSIYMYILGLWVISLLSYQKLTDFQRLITQQLWSSQQDKVTENVKLQTYLLHAHRQSMTLTKEIKLISRW